MIRTLTIAGAVLTLAACSSSSGGSKPPKSSSAPTSASAYSAAPGADAALIASHITGCTGVAAGTVGAGAQTGLTSTATCTLAGHLVILDSFSDGGTADISQLATTDQYYAQSGQGWVAFLADETGSADTTVLQMQITNQASELLGATPRPVDADAQKTLMGEITKDLGGYVEQGKATS